MKKTLPVRKYSVSNEQLLSAKEEELLNTVTIQEKEFPWKRKYTVVEEKLRPNQTVPNLVLMKEESADQMLQENHTNLMVEKQLNQQQIHNDSEQKVFKRFRRKLK